MALTVESSSTLLKLLASYDRIQTERAITMARLSTGKRINRASDDPAGLIALNALSSEMAAVNAAIDNDQRSKAMLETASGALGEISSLVNEVQRLAVASGGNTLSAEEVAANQAQIDSAIESIDRMVNSTTFNGQALFNGANRITTTLSVADAAHLKDVRVYSRPSGSDSVAVTVDVTAAATRATTSGTVVADLATSLSADTVVTLTGKTGTSTITLTSGSNLASVVSQINAAKGETGVSATSSGTQIKLTSVDYGTDAFVSISALSGDADVVATAQVSRTSGTDATVKVNGQTALVSGTEVYYNGNGVSLSATLATNTTGTRTITITGGGATFQIGTDNASRATLSLGDVGSYALGRSDLGYLSDLKSGGAADLATDPGAAALIAKKAVVQVATAASRIGGFTRYQLDSSVNSLSTLREALAGSISQIGDADYAEESSRLERQNLLAASTLSLISLYGQQQRSVLSLLT
jgi:flagellin